MMDAFNYDSLKEGIELGEDLDEEQKKIWAELQEKMKDNPRLTREMAESKERVLQGAADAIKFEREYERKQRGDNAPPPENPDDQTLSTMD